MDFEFKIGVKRWRVSEKNIKILILILSLFAIYVLVNSAVVYFNTDHKPNPYHQWLP